MKRRLKRRLGRPKAGGGSQKPLVPAKPAGGIYIKVPMLTRCAPVCPLSHNSGLRNTFVQTALRIANGTSMWFLPSLVLHLNGQQAAETLHEDKRHLAFSSSSIREVQVRCCGTPVELRSASFPEGRVRHYGLPEHR